MLVYIKPHSTFPELHSDTIFGALTYAINVLYPEVLEEMVSKFEEGKPPFILSSAFPFIERYIDETNKEIIRFYPKPILGNDFSKVSIDMIKKYKKIKYFDEEIFMGLISGRINEIDLIHNLENYNKIQFLLSKKDIKNVVYFGKNIITNNMVNRLSNKTEVFYTEGDSFKNSGLFFIIEFFDKDYENIVKASIKFLKDRGFGKDISTGKGHFDYLFEKNNLLFDDEGNYFISLSRFIPYDEELNFIKENSNDNLFYEIVSKRGRHSSGDLKKQVRFFKEGSSFPNFKSIYGKIVFSGINVKSIEYGYAFPIKYKGEIKNGL